MSAVQSIRDEFLAEVPAIRRILERVPDDKLAWKPHQKSRSLGELAVHVANIPGLIENIATADEWVHKALETKKRKAERRMPQP